MEKKTKRILIGAGLLIGGAALLLIKRYKKLPEIKKVGNVSGAPLGIKEKKLYQYYPNTKTDTVRFVDIEECYSFELGKKGIPDVGVGKKLDSNLINLKKAEPWMSYDAILNDKVYLNEGETLNFALIQKLGVIPSFTKGAKKYCRLYSFSWNKIIYGIGLDLKWSDPFIFSGLEGFNSLFMK